jgi:uncharacterized protein (DUF2141 family)
MKRVILCAFALPLVGAAPPQNSLDVEIQNLRNGRGVIQACLTRSAAHFPDCRRDPAALKQTVPAAGARVIRFAGYGPGRYALTIFHDENANHRLDTLLAIPREGFGFSRNPRIRFGPPRFNQVAIDLGPAVVRQSVRIQYLL